MAFPQEKHGNTLYRATREGEWSSREGEGEGGHSHPRAALVSRPERLSSVASSVSQVREACLGEKNNPY